jgi:hypothetical protein
MPTISVAQVPINRRVDDDVPPRGSMDTPGFWSALVFLFVSHGATRPLVPVEIIGRALAFPSDPICYLCHRSSVTVVAHQCWRNGNS